MAMCDGGETSDTVIAIMTRRKGNADSGSHILLFFKKISVVWNP